MENLYEKLCQPKVLYDAWLRVARKHGAAGVDSETVEQFAQNAARNILKLARELAENRYDPAPLRQAMIPKSTPGKFRRLGIPTIRDRIVFQAVNEQLKNIWSDNFSPLSFAYKNGTGVSQAIEMAAELIRHGREWFVKGDIRGCFDEMDWGILSAALKDWLPDAPLRALINKAIRVPIVFEGRIHTRTKGVPQGSPISPILANLYLYPFDYQMLHHSIPVIRYADDWLILVHTGAEAAEALQLAQAALSTILIEINPEKSGIGSLKDEDILFLGHSINAHRIDAGPNGWQRFAEALRQLKTARSKTEHDSARSKLSSLQTFYRNSGPISRE